MLFSPRSTHPVLALKGLVVEWWRPGHSNAYDTDLPRRVTTVASVSQLVERFGEERVVFLGRSIDQHVERLCRGHDFFDR
jgi:hypothetical protein